MISISINKEKNFIDLGDYRRSIFLAGTGRSGTTWVEDILNFDSSSRVMFEPFHSKKILALNKFHYRKYLRADEENKESHLIISNILDGNVRSTWVDQFNNNFLYKKRVIKAIRANLMLKYIKVNFPEMPIILLMRHPCAVANSKLKLEWDTHLDLFLEQDKLMLDYLNPYMDSICNATTQYEKHIYMWCIENYVPLKQFFDNEIHIIFYENLCLNPTSELVDLFRFLGKKAPPDNLRLINKPSALSQESSAIKSGESLIDSWKKDISVSQIDKALSILDVFGLSKIYGENSIPLVNKNNVLNLFNNN